MICKHCLVSIGPDPNLRGRWKAVEGEWEGGTHCRDDDGQWRTNERLHEPDVDEPVATTPVVEPERALHGGLHCGRCGMAIRRSVGRDNAWYDVRVGIGMGTRVDHLCPDGVHAHKPGDPPTTEEVEQGDGAPTEPTLVCKHCGIALRESLAKKGTYYDVMSIPGNGTAMQGCCQVGPHCDEPHEPATTEDGPEAPLCKHCGVALMPALNAKDMWIRADGQHFGYRCSGKFGVGPLHEPETPLERLDRLTREATEALKASIGKSLSDMLYARYGTPAPLMRRVLGLDQEYPENYIDPGDPIAPEQPTIGGWTFDANGRAIPVHITTNQEPEGH